MLAGAAPFANGSSDSVDDILRRIGEGNFRLDAGNWLSVSAEAKNLVEIMLDVDPSRRPTAIQIQAHPWMTTRDVVMEEHMLDTNAGKQLPHISI
jgi:serine/threonine protein kinase